MCMNAGTCTNIKTSADSKLHDELGSTSLGHQLCFDMQDVCKLHA